MPAQYAECRYSEYRYAECRYAECRGAIHKTSYEKFYMFGALIRKGVP